MGIYDELNVPAIINAMGTFTIYGGSRMSQQTLDDMQEAAHSFVDIRLLQRSLSQKIAAMTHNEGAYICSSASAGVYLGLLAAAARKRQKLVRHLTRDDFARSEVILFRSHRNPYDIVMEQLGVQLVELAYSNHSLPDPAADIAAAISPETVAVYYLESGWTAPGAPDLETVICAAHQMNVPVILDAAAMLPPPENLWNYTGKGVDMVIFSGGKDLHGPQASGLILGKSLYTDILLDSAFPVHGYGRMFKTGREEMVGLYSALKQFISADHSARRADTEKQVETACRILNAHPLYLPERSYPNEAGQPIPRVLVHLTDPDISSGKILSYLAHLTPPVIAASAGSHGFYLNPMSLTPDEMEWICQQLLIYGQNSDHQSNILEKEDQED